MFERPFNLTWKGCPTIGNFQDIHLKKIRRFSEEEVLFFYTLMDIAIMLLDRTAIDTMSLSFKNVGTKSLQGNLLDRRRGDGADG